MIKKQIQLSVIFGYRDRETTRLKRCLDSLTKQTFEGFEVIFVDYGSQHKQAAETKALVESYSFCKYVYSDTRGWPWNRSRALNTGVKLAQGEYVMTTDVDMIYPNDFLATFIENLDPKKVLHVFHHFLPKRFKDWNGVEKYTNYPVAVNAHGACHCIRKDIFEELGGFDEFYCYWGIEDRDLKEREMAYGLSIESLNGKTNMFHQWHTTANYNTLGFLPQGLWQRMESHYHNQKDIIQRNPQGWGKIYKTEDRSLLKHIDFEKREIIEGDKVKWFDKVPTKSINVTTMLQNFADLPSGNVLAINQGTYPYKRKWLLFLLDNWNKLMRKTGFGLEMSLNPNLVHGSVYPFVIDSEQVSDYYLDFPAKKGVSLLEHK